MDQAIRNKLRNVVTQCRKLLEDDTRDALEGKFGIFARKDQVTADPNAKMTHLTDEEQAARKDILDHFAHIKARGFKPKDALDQLVREIAFTHLNRLCAYKMMEAREVYVGGQKFREAVSRGVNSNGVKFYLAEHEEDERLFNTGHQDVAYRHFLDWLGGTLSEEIGVLFNPNDPANRLYPRQKTLDDVLDLLNGGGIKAEETELREQWPKIWAQDETIGWVYQYFTPKELRDQARKESQAPRNSYELAFRNQFFTPRYVVEFLTDNTLGRIWYEMRKGDTKLKDQCRYLVRRPTEIFLKDGQQQPASLPSPSGRGAGGERDDISQEDLLKLPVHIPHRPKKDPRELKILDPACGSGHFLLYCFDLLLTIYEEAYADPNLGPALQSDYPKLEDLRRDVPRLILAHNLHGIDIDLRASQIAALALWLRCQRAYQEMGLKKDRPKITRSNFVCAEPMPGEEQMLKEFVGQLEPKVLGQVVEVVFEKMKLAGEAGSLLKIEEEIRDAVAAAKKQWVRETAQATDRKGQPLLFTQAALDQLDRKPEQQSLFDFSDMTDDQFFEQAEARVIEALRSYAEKAQNDQRLQRRLFTEDAVRGFSFVDICQKRYDVVLMNPPFGNPPASSRSYLSKTYPLLWADMYAAFVTRTYEWLNVEGRLGAITSRTFLALASFEPLRNVLLNTLRLSCAVECGLGVLDAATVRAAFFVAEKSQNNFPIIFLDLRRSLDRGEDLLRAVSNELFDRTFIANADAFRAIPGKPFCYWLPPMYLDLLSHGPHLDRSRLSEGDTTPLAKVAVGASTTDDERFVRCHWEVLPADLGPSGWTRFAHAMGFCRFYAPTYAVLKWYGDGKEMLSIVDANGNVKARLRCFEHFFKSGLVSPYISELGLGCSFLARDHILSNSCRAYFDISSNSANLLAYLNSSVVDMLIWALTPDRKHEAGIIAALPIPESVGTDKELGELGRHGWELARQIQSQEETDPYFVRPALDEGSTDNAINGLLAIHDKIDSQVARHFGMSSTQIAALLSLSGAKHFVGKGAVLDEDGEEVPGDEQSDNEGKAKLTEAQVRSQGATHKAVLSYSLGCCFGRWDIRCSIGDKSSPNPSDPISPLPSCPPGLLQGANGLPATAIPRDYPLCIDGDGIIPDDSDHTDDIVRRMREVLELIWKGRADAIEKEACEILGVKELLDYFRKPGKGGFWDDHISRYSKSRRKAPIYWLLQSSKKNYALWLYYHRLDKDLLFKALVNYVEPKIRLETSRLETLRNQKTAAGESGKEAKRLAKDIERQEDFLSELRDFEDKLRRAASLHLEPDLNDGVVLNIAPLHELVPWKEAKNYWAELLAGKYEWSSIGKQLRVKGCIN